jgi:hypothetical protein
MTGVVLSSRSERVPPDQVSLSPLPPVPSSSYRGILRQPRVSPGPPADQVTLNEAAVILGCSISTVRRLVLTARGRHGNPEHDDVLMRANVEALATEVYSWRLHLEDADPYWLTGQRAADTLGISRARLSQLAADNRIPFVRHQDGTRMYRRGQLEMIASAGSLGRKVSASLANRMQNSTPLTPDGGR